MDRNSIHDIADLLLSGRFETFYKEFISSGEYNENDEELRNEIAKMFGLQVCKYCGGDCPNNDEFQCDEYSSGGQFTNKKY